MQVHRGALARPGVFRRPVATLGVFDGVHRGHQEVLQHVRAWAERCQGESVAITFDPHPLTVLRGSPPALLTPLPYKLELFAQLGLDHTVLLPFTDALAEVSAEEFVDDILVRQLGTQRLVLGPDAYFGKDRQGNAAFVQAYGKTHGLEVEALPFLTRQGAKVSSTRIRRAVQAGELEEAATLLGRPYVLYGSVVRGDGRGRVLGYPTANLATEQALPPRGVYFAEARRAGEAHSYRSLCNIGVAPTVAHGRAAIPEVHLLDFDEDLYGRPLEVCLRQKLRAEMQFADRSALVEQIGRDVAQVRALEVSA